MSIPNPLEKLESGHNIALSYSNLSTIMASMSGVVWMVSEGARMMLRWGLRVSGDVLIRVFQKNTFLKNKLAEPTTHQP